MRVFGFKYSMKEGKIKQLTNPTKKPLNKPIKKYVFNGLKCVMNIYDKAK